MDDYVDWQIEQRNLIEDSLTGATSQYVITTLVGENKKNFRWVATLGREGRWELADDANLAVASEVLRHPGLYCGPNGAKVESPFWAI